MVVKAIFDIFGHLPWLCQFPRILGEALEILSRLKKPEYHFTNGMLMQA